MAKAKSTAEVSEDLGLLLADTLNKKFKDHSFKTAYFLEGDSDAPVHVNEFVSTGSSILDLAISNRKDGGFPVGRITEITGLEQSGKSLLAAHALANTQKKGGMAVFIDTENAVPPDFFNAVGVDLKKMLYIPLDTVEDIFDVVETLIEKIRVSDKKKLVTIVIDSIAGASTKQEMEADFDKDGYATAKAIILGKKTSAIVFKNKIGPPERGCQFDSLYSSGIDNYSSWLIILKDYKLINQSGAWYSYVNKNTGEEIKFQSKDFTDLILNDENLYNTIYDEICEHLIMKYESSSLLNLDDVITDENTYDEND
jgi:RecA/RadA recombinase